MLKFNVASYGHFNVSKKYPKMSKILPFRSRENEFFCACRNTAVIGRYKALKCYEFC